MKDLDLGIEDLMRESDSVIECFMVSDSDVKDDNNIVAKILSKV